MVRSRDDQKEREEDRDPKRVKPNPHRTNPRKSQAPRDQPGVREPRNASLNTLLAWDANKIKDTGTLQKYGTGFRFAWKHEKAREILVKAGFKAPGAYPKRNQTQGRIFTLPREVPREDRFGGEEAGMVMRIVLKAHATRSQAEGVRKMLSYVRQLQTGDELVNFKRVGQVWNRHDEDDFGEPTQRVKAEHILEPEQFKTALTKGWNQQVAERMLYCHWSLAYLLLHHWVGLGLRPKKDFQKVKSSRIHVAFPSQGYMYTQFNGGRAKLDGKKGVRPWRAMTVCWCPGAKHKGPPENFRDVIIDEEEPSWNTACPISCFQVIRAYLELEDPRDPRIFPKPTNAGFCKSAGKEYKSIGPKTMFPLIQKFLEVQGANPDGVKFCTNSGRHALGKLLTVAGVPYWESFEITGDLFKNWKVYQEHLKNDLNFTRRTQAKDLDTVLKPLWAIARWCGRGPEGRQDPENYNMNHVGKLLALLGRNAGLGADVNRILDGMS